MSEYKKIYEAMGNILLDCVAIAKDRRNQQQKFQYRGVDDAYNAMHPIMAKHNVFTVPRVVSREQIERQTKNGGALFYTTVMMEYDFICGLDGSKVTVGPIAGEAMDMADKSSNKAMSVAHKMCLFQTFLIPTEQEEADQVHHEVAPPAAMATDKQLATIQEYKDADKIHAPTQKWIDQNTPLTEPMAAGLIRKLKEAE